MSAGRPSRQRLKRGSDLASDGRGIDLFRYKANYQLKRARNNELRILTM